MTNSEPGRSEPVGSWTGSRAASKSVPHCTTVFSGRQAVGEVRGDTFRKSVHGSRHMLRRPPAWALDVGSLAEAERLGARRVELSDRNTGQVYAAPIALIHRRGFLFDRGFGRQVGLALELWRVEKPGQLTQLSLSEVTSG